MPTLEIRPPVPQPVSDIIVEPDSLSRLGDEMEERVSGNDVLLVSDATVANLHADSVLRTLEGKGFKVTLHVVPPGEGSKSMVQVERIHQRMAQASMGRDATVVALGGGVVSDLAGFAASIWMRGVTFIICPTTMESAIDASVGGKTAVNLPQGKNLVGAFHQPRLVLIDPTCLKTLSPRDLRAGLAESIKHAALFSEAFLEWHETHRLKVLDLNPDVLAELIYRNVALKAEVVAEDPMERAGRRILLNFGHTLGHAIESLREFDLRHGECVALGMAAAIHLSQDLLGFPHEQKDRLLGLIRDYELPISFEGLPCEPPDPEAILKKVALDKKNLKGVTRFVLLERLAAPRVISNVSPQPALQAYQALVEPSRS